MISCLEKANTSDGVFSSNNDALHLSKRRIVVVAHPILKALGVTLMLGALIALSSFSLINPILAAEMMRLTLLCALALLLQSKAHSRSDYTDHVVTTFLYA